MIDTEDLTSYHPGYDEQLEPKTVPYEDYDSLREERDRLEGDKWELEAILKNILQIIEEEDWRELQAYVEEDCKPFRRTL